MGLSVPQLATVATCMTKLMTSLNLLLFDNAFFSSCSVVARGSVRCVTYLDTSTDLAGRGTWNQLKHLSVLDCSGLAQ